MNNNVDKWNISIVGAGTMGTSLALFYALSGYHTKVYNRTAENLKKAEIQVASSLDTLVQAGEVQQNDTERILSNLSYFTDLEKAVQDTDYVIENVSEKKDIKIEIFKKLDQFCSQECILASNTSTFNIYEFIHVSNPDRLVITHYLNPAHIMPIVEIIRGEKTSGECVDLLKEFFVHVKKSPIVMNKCIEGFIWNRLQMALGREATYLVDEGLATVEDIDTAMKCLAPRYLLRGIFTMYDFNGIDILNSVFDSVFPTLCNAVTSPKCIMNKVSKGELGIKTGRGFNDYSNEDIQKVIGDGEQKLLDIVRYAKKNIWQDQ
jgi:3-hydroxybutyryl-CoA dehydrogenase